MENNRKISEKAAAIIVFTLAACLCAVLSTVCLTLCYTLARFLMGMV